MQHLWHHAKNLNAGYEETEYVYKNKKTNVKYDATSVSF